MFKEIVTEKEIKFNELEKKIYKYVCMLGCLIIKIMLEKKDKKIKETRDKKKYRDKGKRKNTIKTIMGEVEYKRTIYQVEEGGVKKTVYLLDKVIEINTIGKISSNVVEKIIEVVPKATSYRKAEEVIETTTNIGISFEAIRNVTIEVGEKIGKKEKEERRILKKEQIVEGVKEIAALFEEADGIWINLQGKERKERLAKYKEKCEKENKEYNERMKIKTEVKLHVMYEGWKKIGKNRYKLVGKEYIAGIMTPKELKEIRDARVKRKYAEEKIKLRVVNGDGARWTKGITSKGGIYQKDQFHIMQEIVRDVPEEYRGIIKELIEKKEYEKIEGAIAGIKYEVGGEYREVKKLEKLQSYLSSGLERYQDITEVPEAPEGIEYRNMGTQESQIFSKLKTRLCSGRKAFSSRGANALTKVCVISEKFSMEELESEIEIDTSVEDWIREIEEKVKANKRKHRTDERIERKGIEIKQGHIESENKREIERMLSFTEMELTDSVYC